MPVMKPFAKIMRAIPIASEQNPRDLIHALHTASAALLNNELVCHCTRGEDYGSQGSCCPSLRRGLERIMNEVPVDRQIPIIPVKLHAVWGSIFSFERGRFLWKMPRRIPYRVTVSYGKPMLSTSTAIEIRAAVQELHAEAFAGRKQGMKTLDRAFVRTARRHPMRFLMADGRTPRVSFGSALNKTMFIAQRLKSQVGTQPMVGMLLPPSVGAALTNYALMLLGPHCWWNPELHVFERDTGFLRGAVRDLDGCDYFKRCLSSGFRIWRRSQDARCYWRRCSGRAEVGLRKLRALVFGLAYACRAAEASRWARGPAIQRHRKPIRLARR